MDEQVTLPREAWEILNRDLFALEKRVAILEGRPRRVSLKGLRTKIVGWLSSLPMVTLASGLTIDPAGAAALIEQHGLLLAGVQIALSAGVHYYRGKADVLPE